MSGILMAGCRVTDVKGWKSGKGGNYAETTVSAIEKTEKKVNVSPTTSLNDPAS